MLKRFLAIVVAASMVSTGCASASGGRVAMQTPSVVDASAMAEYIQRIPPGSRVKVERTNGDSMRGTLMKASAQGIVVQRNSRVPEPPIDVPVAQLARVTLDQGGSTVAKAIGIGIASGAATFFALIALAYAISD